MKETTDMLIELPIWPNHCYTGRYGVPKIGDYFSIDGEKIVERLAEGDSNTPYLILERKDTALARRYKEALEAIDLQVHHNNTLFRQSETKITKIICEALGHAQ